MTNSKNTKRALVSSALAILMCVAMLIGTTFAWFTDTASTSVNKIQAGTLDVQLVDKDGNDLEGKTLDFAKAAGHESEAILWEPGCTYELPAVYVKNNGNLALKYKIQITGINGDAKLNEAIEWTIGGLDLDTEGTLLAGKTSDALTIKGHMKEDAGNEYQGLSIDGISITVVATQYTYEYDSNDNQYDANAKYLSVEDLKAEYGVDGLKMPAGVEITDTGSGFTVTLKDEEAFLYFTQVFEIESALKARETALNNGTITKYPSETGSTFNMWHYGSAITVKMDCDVDLKNIIVSTVKFSRAYGPYFDGCGHTIKNARMVASSGTIGFFGAYIHVSNVTFDNFQVSAAGCTAAAVVSGSANGGAEITNVTVKNSSVIGGRFAGAIAGETYGSITDCKVENTVVCGQYKVGGITGQTQQTKDLQITGNTLTNVTVKGDNIWSGKTEFVLGKVIGCWASPTGNCQNNTTTNMTSEATDNIGEIATGYNVTQD